MNLLRPTLVVAVLATTVLLTACNNPPQPSGSPSASVSPSASPSPSPTTPPPPPPASAPCTRDNLTITYAPTDNSAGHAHGILTFTNSSSTKCSMTGYPIVYFDNPEAQQLMGLPAGNDPVVAPSTVEVAPGGAATAALTITQAGFVDGCTITQSPALLLSPPLDHPFDLTTDGRWVPIDPVPACSNDDIGLLTVGAVTAG